MSLYLHARRGLPPTLRMYRSCFNQPFTRVMFLVYNDHERDIPVHLNVTLDVSLDSCTHLCLSREVLFSNHGYLNLLYTTCSKFRLAGHFDFCICKSLAFDWEGLRKEWIMAKNYHSQIILKQYSLEKLSSVLKKEYNTEYHKLKVATHYNCFTPLLPMPLCLPPFPPKQLSYFSAVDFSNTDRTTCSTCHIFYTPE